MKPVIALIGPGELGKKAGLSGLLDSLDRKSVYSYYLGETEASFIFSECSQDSLFSSSKAVLVKNIDEAKDKEKKLFEELLDNYLDNINKNTVLIITADELPEGLLNKIHETGEVLQFKKMYKNELTAYVRDHLTAENISFEPELPDFIAMLANEDEWETENMLQSLIYLSGKGKSVTIADAKSLLSRSSNMNIFDLINGIFEKNAEKAALALYDLRLGGEPVTRIVYMIMRSAKMLWSYLSHSDVSMKSYEIGIMKEYSRKCDLKFVSKTFALAGKLEITAKSMKDDFSFIELENFIFSII